MFIDEVKIKVKAGDGGNGIISFRREAFVPKGGPDGGDGGNGGNVYIQVDKNINNLYHLKLKKLYKAERGKDGQGNKRTGAKGKDLILKVAPGTLVYDAVTNKLISDLKEDKEKILIAKGGKGGKGNFRFKDSVHRAPRFAEKGEKGEEKTIILKLKIIADVGLIGMPNAGKSTFLKIITKANPKIANYPFTTLYPQLGRFQVYPHFMITFADIPGLIKGASKGTGLGIKFLKHIERTKILLHLVDVSFKTKEEIIENINSIRNELYNFSQKLSEKKEIIALNKIDIANIDKKELLNFLIENKIAYKDDIFFISNLTKEGIKNLINRVYKILISLKTNKQEKEDIKENLEKEYKIEQIKIIKQGENIYKIEGKELEKLINKFDFSQYDALFYFNKKLKHLSFFKYITKYGIKEGDLLNIYNLYFYYSNKKLIWKEVE